MARFDEDFFAGYTPAALNEQSELTVTQRELMLIRMGLDVLLRDTSRHDHIFRDIHALRAKIGQAIQPPELPVRQGHVA